jgi:hypothetical protein
MTDYLLMMLEDEAAHDELAAKAVAELIAERAAFEAELRRTGTLRAGGQLRPSKEGRRVRRPGAAVAIEEGPFAEEGKALGAYAWVEAPSLDAAAEIARRYPALAADAIDVRPVMKGKIRGNLEAPGKIFACAVLGRTATEEAWVQVMDRIDADTQGPLPAETFPGGVRLEPPRAGRRVATKGEGRAIFDGPFLESKEVIGGVFFVRMPTIDDAVRWAVGSPFLAHGTLEIRERWRT